MSRKVESCVKFGSKCSLSIIIISDNNRVFSKTTVLFIKGTVTERGGPRESEGEREREYETVGYSGLGMIRM